MLKQFKDNIFTPILYVLISISCFVVSASAGQVTLTGVWIDKDKTCGQNYWYYDDENNNDKWDQEEQYATFPVSGWNFADPWKEGWFDDLNYNGSHEAGEPADKFPDSSWTNGKEAADASCWMASAANVLIYAGGPDKYKTWARDGVCPELFTFDNAGQSAWPLTAEGYRATDGIAKYPLATPWFVNPVEWTEARLMHDLPVAISIALPIAGSHSLTSYAINTTEQTLTVTDSAQDPNGQNHKTYNYTYAFGITGWTWTLDDYDPFVPVEITYAASLTPCIWQGSGTGQGTSDWNTNSNWSVSEVPGDKDIAEVCFTETGLVDISGEAYAHRLRAYEADVNICLQTGGSLTLHSEYLGDSGQATFTQNGGTHTIGRYLHLGRSVGGTGKYVLNNGILEALRIYVGQDGSGVFEVNGGSAKLEELYIAVTGGSGQFAINDSFTDIEIQARVVFGPNAVFTAVPGSTVDMNDADFENYSINDSGLSGLSNLNLVFNGPQDCNMTFEAASKDLGPVLDGFINNFHLAGLTVGSDSNVCLELEDWALNTNQGGPPSSYEAVYVDELFVGAGSILKLNELNLYTKRFRNLPPGRYTCDVNGIDFNGGSLFVVSFCDLDSDGIVNFEDFAFFAEYWLQPCRKPFWCCGADFDESGRVDSADLKTLADSWLSCSYSLVYAGYISTSEAVKAVAISGDLLLAGSGRILLSVDISNPTDPTLLGQIILADTITDIDIRGSLAYVAVDDRGLCIIDVTDPCNLTQRGSYDDGTIFLDVDVMGSCAYAANYSSGLKIIDISNPGVPEYVEKLYVGSYAHGIAASGDGMVYVHSGSDSDGYLTAVDVANPNEPSTTGSCSLEPYPLQSGTAYKDGFAYASSPDRIEIIDVSVPASLQVVSSVEVDRGYDLRLDGNILLIASKTEGLVPVLVSNPTDPVKMSAYSLLGSGFSVDVENDLVCVGLLEGGIQIFRKVGW